VRRRRRRKLARLGLGQDAASAMGALISSQSGSPNSSPSAVKTAVIVLSRQVGKTIAHREVGLNSGYNGAGGTGIEPATCGVGESGAAFFPV
jgi:hypothetical protein